MCVCLNSALASGDDVQNISVHRHTCKPQCKLRYRQDLSPASPRPCSHVLQITPLFLVNTMQLSPSNWYQPTQMPQSSLRPICGCQTLVFPVKYVIAFLWGNRNCHFVQASIEYRQGSISFDNYRCCSKAVRYCSSTFMMLVFFLFATTLMTPFSMFTVSKLTALWFFMKFF